MLLQTELSQSPPSREVKDKILWCLKIEYNVKALFAKAQAIKDQGAVVDNLVCTVWQKIAPSKVETMMWLTLLGRLNTKDLLCRKEILPLKANVCSFCTTAEQTVDHLLLTCQLSWQIWCVL